MPLSDHEQHILQEIERQFYEQDPKFARGVAATTLQTHALRKFRRGVALGVFGFVLLCVFFFHPVLVIGVAAFLLMLGGFVLAYHSARKSAAERPEEARSDAVSRLGKSIQEQLKRLRRHPEG